MGKRVTILEAVKLTGLTEYTLRQGIKQHRIPHIRTSSKGKILLDIDLLEEHFRREAMSNITPSAASNVVDFGQLRRVNE